MLPLSRRASFRKPAGDREQARPGILSGGCFGGDAVVPKIAYTETKFRPDALAVIAQANRIIAEYLAAGFRLTLRQLYYQFVSRDWLPNQQREYKRLGSIINDARLAGLIEVVRIALNMDQVEEFNPPPNPAKLTDSRFEGYAAKFGNESWELGALNPDTIAGLIEAEVEQRIYRPA